VAALSSFFSLTPTFIIEPFFSLTPTFIIEPVILLPRIPQDYTGGLAAWEVKVCGLLNRLLRGTTLTIRLKTIVFTV
ncbi:MAG: hypothetical protein Q4C10_14625, partial [Clostridia bacterium]|nr:hypothetical protein [Clostridia bacterium]